MEKSEHKIIKPGKWICDCDKNGNPISVIYSREYREILGYTSEKDFENTHDRWASSLHPEDAQRVLEDEQKTFSKDVDGNDIDIEYRLLTANGYRWFHDYAHIERNPEGVPVHSEGIVFDITEQKEHTEKLNNALKENKKQSRLLKYALDNVNEHLSILVSMARIFYSMHLIDLTNDTVKEFSARDDVKEVVNHKNGAAKMMEDVINTTVRKDNLKSCLKFTNLYTLSERMKGKNILTGEFIGNKIGWFLATFITIEKDDEDRPTKVIFTSRSIDVEKQKEQVLLLKSETDEMTGFFNRRKYEEDIESQNNKTQDKNFVYISLDVNGLKIINDTLGHKAGDELITGACECMKNHLGPYGSLYRTGGDEFAAMLSIPDKKLNSVLIDFQKSVDAWKGKYIDKISVSYGSVSSKKDEITNINDMSVLADKRMYKEKSQYYQRQGLDRRGQKDSHNALCLLYTKILKINITEDSYQIVDMFEEEKTTAKGFNEKISLWLKDFGTSGQVHSDDLQEYLEKTDIKYMQKFFKDGNKLLRIFYKRKYESTYKRVMMEIIPASDYTNKNQILHLYVKDIN